MVSTSDVGSGAGLARVPCGSMRCPVCASLDDKVVDSRLTDDGDAIRRRRECLGCGRRVTTFERSEEAPLIVVKRTGDRQAFDRGKVVRGMVAAAKNRPVEVATMELVAAEIEEELRMQGVEVTAESIGQAVLGRLRILDHVAYVRFASVYKDFDDVADFEREVGLLTDRSPAQEPTPPRSTR